MNSDFQQLCNTAEKQFAAFDFVNVIKTAQVIETYTCNINAYFIAGGWHVDAGTALDDTSSVEHGLTLFLKGYKASCKMKIKDHVFHSIFYNIANGYLSIYKIKKKKANSYGCFSKTEIDTAKKYYHRALIYSTPDEQQLSMTYVNLGNCYSLIGRKAEALEYYNLAIQHKPDHGMALANKAETLYYYSKIIGEHESLYLHEAYNLISKALLNGVEPVSVEYYRNITQQISSRFHDKEVLFQQFNYPGITTKGETDQENALIIFNLKNDLYLNLCSYCQKCNAAIGDSIIIKKLLVPIPKDDYKGNRYYTLSKYINQIKQDYVSARFLLFLSQHKIIDLKYVDKKVILIDALDYNVYNIYLQFLMISFEKLYNILDKIAYFLNDYLNLGIRETKIDFDSIWYSKGTNQINPIFLEKENYCLNALYDIHIDIKNGRLKYLKNIRNALVHRFVEIKYYKSHGNVHTYTEDELYGYSITLAKTLRNAIVYIINAISYDECKNGKNRSERAAKMYTSNIPDDHKHIY